MTPIHPDAMPWGMLLEFLSPFIAAVLFGGLVAKVCDDIASR